MMWRDVLMAGGISFGVSLVLGPIVIPLLRRLKIGQTVRKEGPETHLKKSGTPTMGGVIFLVGVLVASIPFASRHPGSVPVLLLTLAFGLIGFIDDFIKVVLKRSEGLAPWQKMLLQILVTGVFTWYLYAAQIAVSVRIPFTKITLDTPMWIGIPLIFFVVLGTDTGTNFTDGVDGLASSVTAVIALFFVAAGMILKPVGGADAVPVAAAVFGGLVAFLIFNWHPAQVFMGDTGALALGGFVSGIAILMHLEIFIVIVGVIYVAEVLSVMIQVSYFKITHGKRIFRMAPLHHHFEKGGMSEVRVVCMFSIITLMMCLLGIGGLL